MRAVVDWKKLGGDEGEEVPTSRWGRLASLTGLTAGLSARLVGHKLASLLTLRSAADREERLSRLMEREGRRLVEVLGRMKGASMKVGQMLSADPDLVPPELAQELARLQTSAPPMPWSQVKQVLEAAWERPIESIFATFEPEPRGAASIGQVHRGVLFDGRVVAVKLQYPGVERALESDLANLSTLLTMTRLVFDKQRVMAWRDEVRDQLLSECDYLAEGEELARGAALFAGFEGFVTPTWVPEWTRKDVLVMTWLDGRKLDEALAGVSHGERQRACESLAKTWVEGCFSHHFVHGDPHPGNFLWLGDGRIGVLDFGAVKHLEPAVTDGLLALFERLWAGDADGVLTRMIALGFGEPDVKVDPTLLMDYLRLVCAPFLSPGPFDYGAWRPHRAIKRETLSHPSLWRMAPPRDVLPLLRVASGMKGLFARLGVSLDVRAMLTEVAARRGVGTSTGERLR